MTSVVRAMHLNGIYRKMCSNVCLIYTLFYKASETSFGLPVAACVDLSVPMSIDPGRVFRLQPRRIINLDPTDKNLTDTFQHGDKEAQSARNAKMTNAGTDIQPTTLVPDHEEEVQCHDVADGHHHHEKRAWSDTETAVQDSKVSADDSKRDNDLQDQQSTLREGVEDWY